MNIWTRVSMTPEKSYPLDFPSYGMTTFREYGQEDPEILIYGKSNGQMGLINVETEVVREMQAHTAAIKDIVQIDQHHFLTASYDWTMKVWGLNHDKKEKNFASERITLKGSSGRIHCLCKFGPNILSGGADNTIRLWDVLRSSFDQTFIHEKEVYALAEIRNEFFASGGELKELRVWDYRKTKAPLIRYPVQYSINSILKYDQNTIIFNDKNIVKVIDIRNFKQPVLRLQNGSVYSHSINAMTFLSDVEIGMGGSDGFITLWKY